MSVATPTKTSSRPATKGSDRVAPDQLIATRIAEACRALWWAELVRTALGMVVIATSAVLIWSVIDQWIYSPGRLIRSLAFCGLLGFLGSHIYRRLRPLMGSSVLPEYAARSLERDMPELRHALTSYVTLRDDRDSGDLRSRVVRSIGASTANRLRGHDALPLEATNTLRWWVVTAGVMAVLVGYAAFSPKNTLQSAARLVAPIASIDPPRRVDIEDVQPGDSEAIAGRSIDISASITGLRNEEKVVCHWELPSGREQFPLVLNSETQQHTGLLELPHTAIGVVRYTVEAGDAIAGPFRLTVKDLPVVALEAVDYAPPRYTGQEPYSTSSGAITAVDGTIVTIRASTNRAIEGAKIEFNPRVLGSRVQATAGATEMEIDSSGTELSVQFALRSARGRSSAVELEDYRIFVWDSSDQSNPEPIIYPIQIVPDLPPEVAITVPASSPKELPIGAQQIIEVHASDPDFGLKNISLEIRAGIDLIEQPVLWQSELGEKGHQVAEFRLRPRDLQLRIGDTVEVRAVATDNRTSETDPNLEPNVTRTDPVTLKITASGTLPEQDDPNADGVSRPDKSSNQDDSDSQSSNDSGQQEAGGGGSGSGSQKQSGGDQGEGGTGGDRNGGDQTGDESNGDSSNQDGSQGGDTGSSNSNQQGESGGSGGGQGAGNSDAKSDSSQDSSQDNTDQQSSGQQTPDGEDQSRGDPGEASPSGNEQNDSSASPQSSGSDNGNGSQNGSPENADQSATGSNEQGSSGAGGEQNGGEQNGGEQNGGEQNGDQNQQDRQSDGISNNQNGDRSTGEPRGGQNQAPQHDGEAFERIKEYLEKNQASNRQKGEADQKDPVGAPDQQAGDQQAGDQQAGDQQNSSNSQGSNSQKQDGSESTQNSQNQGTSDSQGDAGSRTNQDNDSQTDRSDQIGDSGQPNQSESDQGDQAAGTESETNSNQTPSNQDSANQDSANQDSANQDSANQDSANQDSANQTDASQGDPQGNSDSSLDSGSPDQQGSSQQSESSQASGDGQQSGDESGSDSDSAETGSEGANGDIDGQDSGQSERQRDSENQSSGNGQQDQSASPQQGRPPASDSTGQASSGGVGEGGDFGELNDQSPMPPDPVNVEYAKEATDLVLDYLEQTRESPDPKLLEELKWSREDLRRFSERWRQIRDLPQQSGIEGNREMEEALKSLGLRSRGGSPQTTRESADGLPRIRDAGNRQAPPAAFRDAFDAFRRAVGSRN